MKRILTLLKQDWTNVLRDNILIFVFLAPVLISLAVRLLAPSLETVTVRVALNESMPVEVEENLGNFAQVSVFPNRDAILNRVELNDDVPGFYWENGEYEIILQGNEQEGETLSHLLLQAATDSDYVSNFNVVSQPKASVFTEYALIFTIMAAVMLGAVVESFNMVHDKESGMIRAWSVSPLRMSEMTIARALFAMVVGLIMTVIAILIVAGIDVTWWQVLIGYLASIGIGILMGFLMGGLSNTQLQMLAIIKFVLLAYTVLPILTIFVPDGWRFFFYLFPNYWMFTIFQNIFVSPSPAPVGFWASCGLTLAVTLVYLAVLFPVLKKKLRLK